MAIHFLSEKFHLVLMTYKIYELLAIYFVIPSTCPAHDITRWPKTNLKSSSLNLSFGWIQSMC